MPESAASKALARVSATVGSKNNFSFICDLRNAGIFWVAYLAAYGCASFFSQTAAAPLWYPDSVLLCALLLSPPKKWWIYIITAFSTHLVPMLNGASPYWFIFVTAINDLLKAAFTAYVLRTVARVSIPLTTLSDFAYYLAVAVVAAPLLSAFGGAAARRSLGYDFWPAWGQWFRGDALANLILTPALLYWCCWRAGNIRFRVVELLLWTSGFAASIYVSLLLTHSNYLPIALYVPVPFLIWAAARFGPMGASTSLSLITVTSVVGIATRRGPFVWSLASNNILYLEMFLFVISVPVLFVAILIRERSIVEQRLRESQQKLNDNYGRVRDLAAKLLSAQEEERKRIALELHDDISQRLSLLVMGLENLESKLPIRMIAEHEALFELQRDTENLLSAVHQLSHQLHSATLQHLGLTQALRGLCRVIARHHDIAVDLRADEASALPHDISICLFRIAQEALNNSVKHSRAKQVTVTLHQKSDSLCLELTDDGIGFDSTVASTGLGLWSMQERVRIVGGSFAVKSALGQGTSIQAIVKIAPSENAA